MTDYDFFLASKGCTYHSQVNMLMSSGFEPKLIKQIFYTQRFIFLSFKNALTVKFQKVDPQVSRQFFTIECIDYE